MEAGDVGAVKIGDDLAPARVKIVGARYYLVEWWYCGVAGRSWVAPEDFFVAMGSRSRNLLGGLV